MKNICKKNESIEQFQEEVFKCRSCGRILNDGARRMPPCNDCFRWDMKREPQISHPKKPLEK